MEPVLARFKHFSAHLDAAREPAQKTFETFAFAAFNVNHSVSPSFYE